MQSESEKLKDTTSTQPAQSEIQREQDSDEVLKILDGIRVGFGGQRIRRQSIKKQHVERTSKQKKQKTARNRAKIAKVSRKTNRKR